MSFQTELQPWSADEIAAALGCPTATAYDWLSERRTPPEWQQRWWLRILRGQVSLQAKSSPGEAPARTGGAKKSRKTKVVKGKAAVAGRRRPRGSTS